MNPLLELHKAFDGRPGSGAGGPACLPVGTEVAAEKCLALANNLQQVLDTWPKDSPLGGLVLIEAHYRDVVAKSNRMMRLLRSTPGIPVNRSVVNARFNHDSDGTPRHVITHCVSKEVVRDTIDLLHHCARFVQKDERFRGCVDANALNTFNKGKQNLPFGLRKTEFAQTIKDCHYVESFSVPSGMDDAVVGSFITLFNTGKLTAEQLMNRLGVAPSDYQIVDGLTFIPNNESVINRIRRETPYLVSMTAPLDDFAQEPVAQPKSFERQAPLIPRPTSEPIVGVIDTGFDENSYFTDWVDYEDRIPDLPMTDEDMRHGTAVSSIIVDGPSLNPWLDDDCGRFRVRHFAVARAGANSAMTILAKIEQIVKENLDIKVWNLSLGANTEVSTNYVSPIAALLDRLQFEYDVIFIVAGTNRPKGIQQDMDMRIGSPADSINSIVVNACDESGRAASYSRCGPVLEFFHKPDVAYYGGDKNGRMRVWSPDGVAEDEGTSLASPWITRKVAYLIHMMGFSRQVAKALIIESASSWIPRKRTEVQTMGFGVPPIRISEIMQTANSEIRFVVSGISKLYDTYQFQLPVPIDSEGRHPFMARATLCYFPQCDRYQGVDYTKTELDLHFGRIKPPSVKRLEKHPEARPAVDSINGNIQAELKWANLPESNARLQYRKWDNVKHISDIEKSRFAARKTYTAQGFWGISLLAKERWETASDEGGYSLPFGIVVTLREMEGRNRIEDFKQQCMTWGWSVTAVTIERHVEIFNEGEQEVTFE